MSRDRNFDDLAELFAGRIYSGSKGRIRLALLERDLLEVMPDLLQPARGLQVLDAGGWAVQSAAGFGRASGVSLRSFRAYAGGGEASQR